MIKYFIIICIYCLCYTSFACSSEAEISTLDDLNDDTLQAHSWRGWALINVCYSSSDVTYINCTCNSNSIDCQLDEFNNAQKNIFTRDHNAILDIKADGSNQSTLQLWLAYPQNQILKYLINFSFDDRYRETSPGVHSEIPIQILNFTPLTSHVISENGNGAISEVIAFRLEQNQNSLEGGIELNIAEYNKNYVPDGTGNYIETDVSFLYSVFLNKVEKQ